MRSEQEPPYIPLPVYLDYQTVFDILAILDDGLSQFQEIKTVYSDSSEKTGDVSIRADARGKIPLGFLSMSGDMGYDHGSKKGSTNTHEISGKKIHTSVSLFSKTRERLIADGLVKDNSNVDLLNVGDFIEFEAKFQKLELAQVLEMMVKSVEIGNRFTDAKGKQKAKVPNEIKAMQETLRPFADTSLVYKINNSNRYIIQLDKELLAPKEFDTLLRGEYRVLGKITRIERNGYNIFESTDLAVFKPTALKDMLDETFQSIVAKGSDTEKMFDMPTEVPMRFGGLIVIVKPVAIFV